MMAGINLQAATEQKFFLLPWIWLDNGPGSEDLLRFHLRDKVLNEKCEEYYFEEGQLLLGKIPIPDEKTHGGALDLLRKVKESVEKITREEFNFLYP